VNALTVWKFGSPDGAEQALTKLQELAKQQLISVDDAAIVSWPEGRNKPKTRNLGSLTGRGALWGGFWGWLFGLIFLVPIAGLAFGAAAGALAGSLSDYGIDDDFIKEVRGKVTPGASALFLLTHGAVVDRVAPEFEGTDMELIRSNLSPEQEQKLREAMGEEEEVESQPTG
jgi:uncharacterized membrane protein